MRRTTLAATAAVLALSAPVLASEPQQASLSAQKTIESLELQDGQEIAQDYSRYGKSESPWYIGLSIGPFFPDEDELETAVGGSVLGGYEFNENWSLDGEATFIGGGIEFIDEGYFAFAITVNPRYTVPLGSTDKTSFYISPGIGFYNVSSDFDDESGFAWQIKGGINYQFNPKLAGFLQLRYLVLSDVVGNEGVGYIAPELGVQFKL